MAVSHATSSAHYYSNLLVYCSRVKRFETVALLTPGVCPSAVLKDADAFTEFSRQLSEYLLTLEQRLFSEGLHVLGHAPTPGETEKYLSAYYEDELPPDVSVYCDRRS